MKTTKKIAIIPAFWNMVIPIYVIILFLLTYSICLFLNEFIIFSYYSSLLKHFIVFIPTKASFKSLILPSLYYPSFNMHFWLRLPTRRRVIVVSIVITNTIKQLRGPSFSHIMTYAIRFKRGAHRAMGAVDRPGSRAKRSYDIIPIILPTLALDREIRLRFPIFLCIWKVIRLLILMMVL